ncbi:Glycosyl transferase family 2 [Proteiniborus ethanoligenes]|uniref:Glycosyl transferase family 2 n=1 Tax=Proteiniborus ethanoligenes TaxID=415015 RepID=A0A1H3K178_9FIRM|nr:glycosyltransferase family 2 protein [Proteiniborus ethanoligenes]SDY45264.1 Glycosyl transferase family 2 [Proteiniborus ethanoligenes]
MKNTSKILSKSIKYKLANAKKNNPVNKKINASKTDKNIGDNKLSPKNANTTGNNGVSVITCTHMYCYMNNIINNFLRQNYKKKELIIILNNNSLNLKEWKLKVKAYKNIKIFKIDEKITVGSCMNFAVKKSKYNFIANFDHDDYYGQNYLNDFMKVVKNVDAGLFGKKTQFVFFEKSNTLAIRNPNSENKYVDFIDGPTVFFKKSIFKKVKYIDSDMADLQLSYDCTKANIKIYSINKENFCYIRKASKDMHTWKIEDENFLSLPFFVLGKTKNFIKHVDINQQTSHYL